jgi:dihydrofolate reductase
MAGKVFFSVTMSLDGFMAPEAVSVEYVFSPEGQNDPRAQRWMTKWSELQAWLFPQRWFRENLKLGEGGKEGLDNDTARARYERTGVSVAGKRMFDAGELAWPEEAPFHTPVFVVTHTKRDPWERPGGTTFHFVNHGIQSALDQAREPAGDRDVHIAGAARRSRSTWTPARSRSSRSRSRRPARPSAGRPCRGPQRAGTVEPTRRCCNDLR